MREGKVSVRRLEAEKRVTFPDSGGEHLVRLESRDESRVESRERLVQRAGEGEGKRGERW